MLTTAIIDLSNLTPLRLILLLSNWTAHECFENICVEENRNYLYFTMFHEIPAPTVLVLYLI